jgi:hypothetical protein
VKYRVTVCLAAWLILLPFTIQAEDAPKDSGIPTVKITLYPQAEPRPALKYKLLPTYLDRKPGNAALFYNKITAESIPLLGDTKLWDNATAWSDAPLSELKKQEVQSVISGWTPKINDIKRASVCDYCDWQFPFREKGYETPLPEMQHARSYARLLAPYARLQIAEGKYDDAIETLRAGYTLAQDVATGPTLIQCLVGSAIAGLMSNQVQEFIQQPDAPNLYWALTDLPKPLVDYRSGWHGEMVLFYLVFPEFQNIEKKQLTPEQWRILFQESVQKAIKFGGGDNDPKNTTFLGAMFLLQKYPMAKELLVKSGWPADIVESMPVSQVVLVAGLRQYEEFRDEWFKWLNLPYPEAAKGLDSYDAKLREFTQSGQEIVPLASMLLPALFSAKKSEIKGERQIAALRVLEALRLYAADHNGRLPDKLDDITQVPVPLDPVYGKPFIYYLVEGKAILESPAAKGMSQKDWLRYEITLKTKGQ